MLSLFRHIRQKLFLEGHVYKYLCYAVGEVVLIVIGILIALQINNWNEQIKMNIERSILIKDLIEDCSSTLDQLDESIAAAELAVNRSMQLLKIVSEENTNLTADEIRSIARESSLPIRFQPASNFFQAGLSTGTIELLHYRKLNDLFVEFEDANIRFKALRDIKREQMLIGHTFGLRNKLGSYYAIFPPLSRPEGYVIPEQFELSKEQFMELLSQKDTFSIFEISFELDSRMLNALTELYDITDEILTTLEDL